MIYSGAIQYTNHMISSGYRNEKVLELAMVHLDYFSEVRTNTRSFQAFLLFIERPKVQSCIKSLRLTAGIDPAVVYSKIQNYQQNAARFREKCELANAAVSRKHLEKLEVALNYEWSKLSHSVNSKIKVRQIAEILKKFKASPAWEESFSWYVVTGRIIPPLLRCLVYPSQLGDRIIVEVFGDANIRDFQAAYKRVELLRCSGQYFGYEIKEGVRKKKLLDERLQVFKEQSDYRKLPSKRAKEIKEDAKAEMKLRHAQAVVGYLDRDDDPEFEVQVQRRAEAVKRKVVERMKKYTSG